MRAELEWGKNQCLYRAAPYSVIYNPNTGLHEMVKPWRGANDASTNRALVKEALRRELGRYRVSPLRPDQVSGMQLNLRELDSIETTLYPLAFHCSRCGRLVAEDPGKEITEISTAADVLGRRMQSDLACPRQDCDGHLIQWNYLTVHGCGESIHLPTFYFAKCPAHGDQDLRFQRHGSERAGDWEIVCRVQGCTHGHGQELFFFSHGGCALSSIADEEPVERRRRFMQYSTGPIAKATNFIPRVLRILNSRTQESSPPPGSREALAVGLGALKVQHTGFRFNGGLSHWMESLTTLDRRSPAQDARLRELALKVPDEGVKAEILKELGQGLNGTDISQDTVLRQLVLDPAYVREATVAAIYNDEDRSTSIEDMLADPTLADETRRGLTFAEALREDLGLVALRHVEDLHLTSCLVGYTRGDYDPARVQLQLYLDSSGGHRQYIVYTNTVETEGLYLQLSPTDVLRWLVAKTGEKHPVEGQYTRDLLTLQTAFEEEHLPPFSPPTHEWCAYYYSIIHTVAHLFIRQLGRFSGLEQEGLSEEIYPYQCGALIYVNQGADFSLEGVRLSFEHHLNEILEGVVQDSKACIYDPECEVYQGACHGCVQLAEISCTNFNRLLDRRLLSPTKQGGLWT